MPSPEGIPLAGRSHLKKIIVQIVLCLVGKTVSSNIKSEFDKFVKRLGHYMSFSVDLIPASKNIKNPEQQKQRESTEILKRIKPEDFVVLLDEHGKELSSVAFAQYLEKLQLQSRKRIIFVIGGAFGVSPEIFQRANMVMALSKMTFSHQMVRLFFAEQLYRAYTIISKESYHH